MKIKFFFCLRSLLALGVVGLVTAVPAAVAQNDGAPAVSQNLAPAADASGALEGQSAVVGPDYRIGVDDILSISVWQEPDLSRNVPVRPDGKISLPLIGDVMAAGKTASQLQGELKLDLAHFVKQPEVTVIVADIRSRRINVIGQVNRPGTYPLTQSMGVLDAIAEAGGLRDFAKKNDIYVLRLDTNGQRRRVPYDYKRVLSGKGNSQEMLLKPHDTVVVP